MVNKTKASAVAEQKLVRQLIDMIAIVAELHPGLSDVCVCMYVYVCIYV